jgi:signal transduction histidine kinase
MTEESDEFQVKIQIIDNEGQSIYLTPGVAKGDWPVDEDLLNESLKAPTWSDIELNDESYLVLTQAFVPPGKKNHFIQLATSRADINHIREQIIYCINIGTPLILLAVLFFGHLFAKKALEPVQRTLDQMKQFVADASHELRIPLTGIRGLLEVALRKDRTKEEYKQAVESAYHESERMSELVWDLLSLARADSGEMTLEKNRIDLPVFVRNIFEEAETLNAKHEVELRLENVPEGRAVFDEAKIQQLVLNLIENAIRYNRPGGEVVLSAKRTESAVVMSVKDSGIGIAPDEQEKIFERFYRVDKARSREAGGTGLGLPIARAIAEAHGGTLTVKSEPGKGSEFILTLPVEL